MLLEISGEVTPEKMKGWSQSNVSAWMGEGFGGEWTHVYMAESLHRPPETITTLLIGYAPIQCFLVLKK